MNRSIFFKSLELVNTSLVNQDIKRAFNSIGSHIFLEFGGDIKIISPIGKESFRKEWIIWINHASWRITKDAKYVVGSRENLEVNIQSSLEKLLGKRFLSFKFLSQFLDAEFNFENGYQLTTFFNWREENQWLLFLPDKTNIEVDCSNHKKIRNIKSIAEHLPIIETYKKLDFPQQDLVTIEIAYCKNNMPTFLFENDISINLEACTWRLEKDKDYLVGYLDDDQHKTRQIMSQLIGKKLEKAYVSNSMMDAIFQFEDQYVLKTFTCCRVVSQWKICSKTTPIFHAHIHILTPMD